MIIIVLLFICALNFCFLGVIVSCCCVCSDNNDTTRPQTATIKFNY
jgi:hypothetical protein